MEDKKIDIGLENVIKKIIKNADVNNMSKLDLATLNEIGLIKNPNAVVDTIVKMSQKSYEDTLEIYKKFTEKYGRGFILINELTELIILGRCQGIPDEQIANDVYSSLKKINYID